MILEEDAEAALGSWSTTGLWHRTTRRAASGSYSWWFGQETNGTYDMGARALGNLVSGPIDLTFATEATVEWDQFFEGEGFGSQVSLGVGGAYLNADSGRLLVSADNGASWQTATTLAHNSPANTFVQYRVDLKRFTGRTIRLSFSFDTFDSQFNQQEGWFIDNIRVSALIPEVPALAVTPAALNFTATAGGLEPPSQALAIANAGNATLNWTASVVRGGEWLQISAASGVGNTTLAVSAFAAGMHPGVHVGTIRVSSTGAQNSPRLVNVTLTVAPPSGPAMAWSFDEGSSGGGVTIADNSGHGRHGLTTG
jgi:hypothetical protein